MSDAPMSTNIIRYLLDTVAAQVLLACAHDAAYSSHRNRHERRILEMGNPDSDVQALVYKVHDAIDEQHICADLGVTPEELGYDCGQLAPSEGQRGGDREVASRLGPARSEDVLCLLNRRKYVGTPLKGL